MMRRLALLALLLLAAPAAAQDARPNADVAQQAIDQLRSPYCPGLMLDVCPSPQAALLRDSIRDLAANGEPVDEIVEWMIGRHGEEWRALPKRSGPGLWAWLLPPALLIGGALAIAYRLRVARASEPPAPTPQSALSEKERTELGVALQDWDQTGRVDV